AFGRGRQQEFRFVLARYVEGAHCAERAYLQRVNAMDHVIDGACGGSEVKNVIDLSAIDLPVDIELEKLELAFAAQVLDVGKPAGEQVVNRNHGVALGEQGITQMGAEKAGSASNERTRSHGLTFFPARFSTLGS